jgi:hypothetical protein
MPDGLAIGQLRRESKLGSDALYRIIGFHDELVEVEVITAPGLGPGRRFRFTRPALEAMAVVEPAPSDPRRDRASITPSDGSTTALGS